MKILLLGRENYPPFRVDSRILFGQALASRGYAIDWLLQSGVKSRKLKRERYGNGVAWIGPFHPGDGIFARLVQTLQATINSFRVIRLARKNTYDVILARNVFVRALACIVAARLSGTKFVYWLSYPYPEAWIYEANSGVSKIAALTWLRGRVSDFLLYRVILPAADFAFVQSEQMKEDVAARGITREKMFPVPMGVDDAALAESVSRPAKLETPTVLYVGTLSRVRRMDFLIRVFAKVIKDTPDAVLYVVGGENESQIDFLRSEASDLGISNNVVFTGMLPQSEAMEWMARATVSVSPFYPTPILNSTSPTKLVEYMAQGSAVVANDHPEQRQTIQESGAGLCVEYDEDAFAAAIVELLSDPERAHAMGQLGQSYVKRKRTYSFIAEMVDNQLQQVITS
jgi:glycosyltransferase involved in cell wall biosynthesis